MVMKEFVECFGITNEIIRKCIDQHISNSWKEKLKEEENSSKPVFNG